jgi:hypothetical protein
MVLGVETEGSLMDAAEDELPVQMRKAPAPRGPGWQEQPDVPGPVSTKGSDRGWQLKVSAGER